MIQFFAPDIETSGMLPAEESLHCIRVLRRKIGDEVHVIDGNGNRFLCSIISADPKGVALDILKKDSPGNHWPQILTLAVAPTKNMDRMEWIVEKATEIGVNRIVPILCEHSERKVIKTDRLTKIAISAMKQSLKATLPQIDEMTAIKDFIINAPEGEKFVGYCANDYSIRSLWKEYHPGSDVVIMIGPEGDFSPEEIKMAAETGFTPVTLGKSRLRTETAAIVSLDMIHLINNLSVTNER